MSTNCVARTLKNYALQRETTGSSSYSFQSSPFSKWELLLKERIRSQRERILSVKSSSVWFEKYFNHIRSPPLNVTIFITHVRNCVMGVTPMSTSTQYDHLPPGQCLST